MSWLLVALVVLLIVAVPMSRIGKRVGIGVWQRLRARATVDERVEQYGAAARQRMAPFFEQAGLAYPPTRVSLVGLKDEGVLELYAADAGSAWWFIRSYPVLGASGKLGPKLREGDRQVPEGVYTVESLNPNSRFHLSLRLNYPNAFELARAAADGRTDPGSDIFIHGRTASIGCLAMGDPAAEELFVLAADVGLANISVLISPVDFRARPDWRPATHDPPWVEQLYAEIRDALSVLPRSSPTPSS
jgi:hypothetical protein